MKTTFCVLAAILAMGFWRFDPTYLPNPHTVSKEAATTGPGTKVAIVNFQLVVQNYPRAKYFNDEIEELLLAFKYKAEKLHEEITWMQNAARTPGVPAMARNGCNFLIQQYRVDFEILERDRSRIVEERRRASDVVIWKEINMGINAVAKAYGLQLVLGCGKSPPIQRSCSWLVPNVESSKQTSVSPAYVHRGIDITETVIQVMLESCRILGGR